MRTDTPGRIPAAAAAILAAILILAGLAPSVPGHAAGAGEAAAGASVHPDPSAHPAPAGRPEGRAWRLAYVEGGPFPDYPLILRALMLDLQARGLAAPAHLPPDAETDVLWAAMADAARPGDRVIFLKDGFFSAGWDEGRRDAIRRELPRRMEERCDVDMILAFGTMAGRDVVAMNPAVPVLAASVTNAVEAGIIESVADSGRDNVVAPVAPSRYLRRALLFREIFPFRKLGVVYEDTPEGRGIAAMGELENAAWLGGFELAGCHPRPAGDGPGSVAAGIRACHGRLAADGVDAVFLTIARGLADDDVEDVIRPLTEAGIPTFAQAGASWVERGALLSLSPASLDGEGRFCGRLVGEIVGGAMPRRLNPIFEEAGTLSVNLRTATLIGWNPPLDVLASVDTFFRTIGR